MLLMNLFMLFIPFVPFGDCDAPGDFDGCDL